MICLFHDAGTVEDAPQNQNHMSSSSTEPVKATPGKHRARKEIPRAGSGWMQTTLWIGALVGLRVSERLPQWPRAIEKDECTAFNLIS